jgi:hypothetical protein
MKKIKMKLKEKNARRKKGRKRRQKFWKKNGRKRRLKFSERKPSLKARISKRGKLK